MEIKYKTWEKETNLASNYNFPFLKVRFKYKITSNDDTKENIREMGYKLKEESLTHESFPKTDEIFTIPNFQENLFAFLKIIFTQIYVIYFYHK